MSHHWHDTAACTTHPRLFRVDAHAGPAVDQAKAICGACPARSECLELAMSTEGAATPSARHGIYGGLTADERHRLHQQRVKQRAQQRREADEETEAREPQRRNQYALAPCGTVAAYRRHQRRHEPIDPACREANRQEWHQRKAVNAV